METRIKNYLGIALILFLAMLAVVAASIAQTYSDSLGPNSVSSFSVSGEGEAVVIPDIARLSFGVITQGNSDIASLQTQNTEKVNAIIDFVKKQGIEDEDIETTSYQVSPRYGRSVCPERGGFCEPSEIVGYNVTQRISVDVRDFEKIGPLLSGVVERGANNVSGPNFTIDDPEEARAEAREEAIAKAQQKAHNIAKSAGFKVGKLLSISEGGYSPFYAREETAVLGMGGADASLPPQIEPGTQEVRITVNLQYEIND